MQAEPIKYVFTLSKTDVDCICGALEERIMVLRRTKYKKELRMVEEVYHRFSLHYTNYFYHNAIDE